MIMAFISGFIYFFRLNQSTKLYIKELVINHPASFNNNLFHILIMLILLICSVLIIGIILNYLYLFFEYFTLGFSMSAFFYTYHFNGIVYGLIYNMFSKMIFLLLLSILLYKFYLISKNNLYYLIKRERVIYYWKPYYQSLFLMAFIVINDIIIKIFIDRFLDLFKFIL